MLKGVWAHLKLDRGSRKIFLQHAFDRMAGYACPTLIEEQGTLSDMGLDAIRVNRL